MKPQDELELAAMLETVALAYGKTITPGLVTLYFGALEDLSLAQVAEGLKAHTRSEDGRFWPTPAHILKGSRGDSEAAAALALSKGRYYGDDAIANRVILAMGGEFACRHMEAGVFTGQFRRLYVALHSAGLGEKLAETRGFLAPGETHPLLALPGGARLLEIEGAAA